jgi:hypothetical protein
MICQFCETTYSAGTEYCPKCGFELVETLADPSSELMLEWLADLFDRRQLDRLADLLEAEKIPYIVHSGTALRMKEEQTLRSSVNQDEWEARIMVASSRLEEARSLRQRAGVDEEEPYHEGMEEPFERIDPR